MHVTLYMDVLFILNTSINLWVISLALYKYELPISRKRKSLVAIYGALFYCLVYYLPYLGQFHMIVAILISEISMIFFLLPKRYHRYRVKVLVQSYFYTFMFWGVINLIQTKWIGEDNVVYIAPFMIITYVIFYVFKKLIGYFKKEKCEKIFEVVIKSSGVEHKVKGLYDSGNSLVEPISKKPVCLMEEELLAKITLENPLYLRAIPYHSIGNERGMLYGVEVPYIRIVTPDKEIVKNNIICAGVNQKITGFGKVQMILHPSILAEVE